MRICALLLALSLCLAAPVIANTLVVPDDYPTILAAYNASGPRGGETSLLRPGTYEGGLDIAKNIRIEGDGEASAIRLVGVAFAVHVDGNRITLAG